LIASAVFQALGSTIIQNNNVEGTPLSAGYGQILAWITFVLYLLAVPSAIYETWYRPSPSTSSESERTSDNRNEEIHVPVSEKPRNSAAITEKSEFHRATTSGRQKLPPINFIHEQPPHEGKKSNKISGNARHPKSIPPTSGASSTYEQHSELFSSSRPLPPIDVSVAKQRKKKRKKRHQNEAAEYTESPV